MNSDAPDSAQALAHKLRQQEYLLATHQSRISSHDDSHKLNIGLALRARKPQ